MTIEIHLTPTSKVIATRRTQGITGRKLDVTEMVKLSLGTKNPFRDQSSSLITSMINDKFVVAIAYGKELALLRTHLKNLPWPISSVEPVYWTGDHAKFIALNFAF